MKKQKTVKIKVHKAESIQEKIFGLIGKTKIRPLYIKTRFGIHTFGMSKNIDILVLDNNDTIVKLKENLSPGQLFFWPIKYTKILELPSGTIKKMGLTKGQKITLTFIS